MTPSTVYIETSVISYYAARQSSNLIVAGHQEATKRFWQLLNIEIIPYVSALVVREAGAGNPAMAKRRIELIQAFTVVPVTPNAEILSDRILASRAIPAEYPEDALHVVVAAVAGVDFIATWNFSHINNPYTQHVIREAVNSSGYTCPEIVSPDELLGDVI